MENLQEANSPVAQASEAPAEHGETIAQAVTPEATLKDYQTVSEPAAERAEQPLSPEVESAAWQVAREELLKAGLGPVDKVDRVDGVDAGKSEASEEGQAAEGRFRVDRARLEMIAAFAHAGVNFLAIEEAMALVPELKKRIEALESKLEHHGIVGPR